MSTQIPDDSTHPNNMDEATRQSLLASIDDDAGDTDDAGQAVGTEGAAGAAGAAGAGTDDPDAAAAAAAAAAGAAGGEGDAAAGAAGAEGGGGEAGAGAAAGAVAGGAEGGTGAAGSEGGEAGAAGQDDDSKPVDRAAFNGVLKDLRETREELKQLKAQKPSVSQRPADRDFAVEKQSLREKWDAGDIDTDEYNEQRDALVVAEAEHRATVRFHELQEAQRQDTIRQQQEADLQSWNGKVQKWEAENADFLANPIRRQAVASLMAQLDAEQDPTKRLSDDALLDTVRKQAHEAFNWNPAGAGGAGGSAGAGAANVDPRAVAAARAAAAASGTPPLPTGGMGSGALAGKVNLEELKPGDFKKLSQAQRAELLDGEL